MIHLRCYFIGADGRFVHAENFACASEADAVEAARRKIGDRTQYFGFELWHGAMHVHTEKRPDLPSGLKPGQHAELKSVEN